MRGRSDIGSSDVRLANFFVNFFKGPRWGRFLLTFYVFETRFKALLGLVHLGLLPSLQSGPGLRLLSYLLQFLLSLSVGGRLDG